MRRTAIVLAVLLGCVLLAAAAIWMFRLSLAQQGLAYWLRGTGLAASARLVDLGPGGVELHDVVLDDQRIARIAIRYDLRRIVLGGSEDRPAIYAVEVEGLRLRADLTGDRPFGGLLDALEALTGPGDPAAPPSTPLPALPPLLLDDAQLDLLTAQGPLRLRLDGSLGIKEPPPAAAPGAMVLDLTVTTLEGPLRLDGGATGLYRPGQGDGSRLSLALATATGPPLRIDAEADIADGMADLAFDLDGDAGLLAALANAPAPTRGSVALAGRLIAPAAPLLAGDLAPLLTGAPPFARTGALETVELVLKVLDLDLPGHGRGMEIDAGLALDAENHLHLRPARLSAAALDPAWLVEMGLPAQAAALLAQGGRITLDGAGGRPGTPPAALLSDADGSVLRLDLVAALTSHAGGRVDTALAGDLRLPMETGLEIGAPAGRLTGTLTLTDLDLPELARLARGHAAFDLEVDADGAELAFTAPVDLHGVHLAGPVIATLGEGWQPLLDQPVDAVLGSPDTPPGGVRLLGATAQHQTLVVTLPGAVRIAAGDALLEGEIAGWLRLSGGFELEDAEVTVPALSAAEVPTPYGLLRGLSLSGRFAGLPGTAVGEARVQVALRDFGAGGERIGDLDATLAAAGSWDHRGIVLDFDGPGKIGLSRPAAPLAGHVRRLDLDLAGGNLVAGPSGLELKAALSLPATAFDPDGGGQMTGSTLAAGRIDVDLALDAVGELQGEMRAGAVSAVLAGPGLSIRDGRMTVRFDGETAGLDLAAARLTSTAAPPYFPDLDLSGSATLAGPALTWRGAARGLGGALSVALQGRHDIAANRGTAGITLSPLIFATGSLQPGDLMAPLAEIQNATGSLSARADLRIGAAIQGTARIELDGIGFTIAGSRVAGLDLALDLTSLDPPASPPGQPFSIARIDAGLPLSGLSGQLQLQDSPTGPVLVVERAEGGFLGGRLVLENAVMNPLAERYDLVLRFRQLELEQILAVADLEEVTGTGEMSGEIPIRIDGASIVIAAGRLDAQAPGTIAFRSEAASQALAPGGEAVDLMLQALDDFHYERLGLTLEKPATGESQLMLRLEGANPAVLDGQPFIFNINLASDAAPLLEALLAGTRISDRLIGQVLERAR